MVTLNFASALWDLEEWGMCGETWEEGGEEERAEGEAKARKEMR